MVAAGPPSLLWVTVRRAFSTGRFFLIYGIIVSLILGLALNFASPSSFATGFPIVLPVFGVVGSMGALVVFTSDRMTGVFEYLLAYGVSPRRLFLNVLYTSLVLVSIVVAVGLAGGLGLFAAKGNTLTAELGVLLGVYCLPMSYISSAFAATIGMFWTSLSTPRTGVNSPIGLIPFIGILPSLATLGVLVVLGEEGLVSAAFIFPVVGGMVGLFGVVVIALLATMGRFLRREQLLSPV